MKARKWRGAGQGWEVEEELKRRVTRMECKRLREEFADGGFMAQIKGCGKFATTRMLQDGWAMPREEGDLVKEYKAMHEDNFLSGLLREDQEGKAEDEEEMATKTKEEEIRNDSVKVAKKLRKDGGKAHLGGR